MGLFDKKYCDFCNAKIGLLGNRKLADGNMCKECASKLSPWFSERKQSTVAEIQEQLDYREANKDAVAAFKPSKTLGKGTKVLLDEDAKKFLVTSSTNWRNANPDVMDFADVTGSNVDTQESKSEQKRRDKDGKEVSFIPPHYTYSYNLYITLNVNNPYFSTIRFKLNNGDIKVNTVGPHKPDPTKDVEYQEAVELGNEIKRALSNAQRTARRSAAAAAKPKQAVTCPWCGATSIPDASGCCEYCGGSLNG